MKIILIIHLCVKYMDAKTKKHVIARPVRKLVVAIRFSFSGIRIATSRFALLAMTWRMMGFCVFAENQCENADDTARAIGDRPYKY